MRSDYDIDFEPDQLACDLGEAVTAAFCPANLNCHVAAFHPTEFTRSRCTKAASRWLSTERARTAIRFSADRTTSTSEFEFAT